MRALLSIAALCALILATLTGPAAAAVRIGVLTCQVAPGVGFIIGSSKALGCEFRPGSGPNERYSGTVNKLGIDIGATSGGVMTWVVFAATDSLRPGALAGGYVGASAEATLGAGIGANVLVGGFNRSITLQPLSVQGQTGLNVAAGIAGLELVHGR